MKEGAEGGGWGGGGGGVQLSRRVMCGGNKGALCVYFSGSNCASVVVVKVV